MWTETCKHSTTSNSKNANSKNSNSKKRGRREYESELIVSKQFKRFRNNCANIENSSCHVQYKEYIRKQETNRNIQLFRQLHPLHSRESYRDINIFLNRLHTENKRMRNQSSIVFNNFNHVQLFFHMQ